MTSFVKVFGAKVSYQAMFTLVVGFVTAFALLFTGHSGMFMSVTVLIIAAIYAYTINCTIVGKCEVFSYVLLAWITLAFIAIVTTYMR